MKIVIMGGTGELGTILSRAFHGAGQEVVAISRGAVQAPWRSLQWDAATHGAWSAELDGADVVINLAGRSVNCRYNPSNRRQIMQSRVVTTRLVGEAVAAASRPPRVWLQASTATIYAHRYDAPNDEAGGIIGGAEADLPDTWRFSLDVAQAWELEQDNAATPDTRRVKMRAAMVMSPQRGGVFDTLLSLVRLGLGGRRAPIHLLDSLRRLRAGHPLAYRPRRDQRCYQHRFPQSVAECRNSCAICARPGAFPSGCPRQNGCSKWVRLSCAARRS